MHEFGIMQSVFEVIEKTAKEQHLSRITKVTMKLGKLRQCFPEFLIFAFKTLSENTLAKDAEFIIEEVPTKVLCKDCHKTFEVERHTYICPHCDGVNLEIISGKEVFLESIEGEKE